MGRTATGKKLSLMPIRVDDDVREALQELMGRHDTLNEGLRSVLLEGDVITPEIEARIRRNVTPRKQSRRDRVVAELAASDLTAQAVDRNDIEYGSHEETPRGQHVAHMRPVRAPLLKPKDKK